MRKSILALALLCAASVMSHSALAWDDAGHKIVALIADHYLVPAAREKVRAILDADSDTLTGHDIASAATWADKYQNSDKNTTQERYNRTYNWHFANIDAGRPNIPTACFGQPALPPGTVASQGPAKDCVIDKINQFAAELADPKVSADERLIALKFLLNLVGDVHQPLNVVDEGNGHGKMLNVVAEGITPGDLYGYWDGPFVHRLGIDPNEVAQRLISQITAADQEQWTSAAPQLWALEAHQLGVIVAYELVGKFDDQGNAILQDKDVERAVRIVGSQLSKAGVRLAYVINEALAPVPASGARKATSGNRAAGQAFARAACSVCHVVAADQRNSNQGALAPDFKAVANTRGVSGIALRGFLFGPHPTMPNMKLSQTQADNLIAYILSLRDVP